MKTTPEPNFNPRASIAPIVFIIKNTKYGEQRAIVGDAIKNIKADNFGNPEGIEICMESKNITYLQFLHCTIALGINIKKVRIELECVCRHYVIIGKEGNAEDGSIEYPIYFTPKQAGDIMEKDVDGLKFDKDSSFSFMVPPISQIAFFVYPKDIKDIKIPVPGVIKSK